jgi:hypothetical protein
MNDPQTKQHFYQCQVCNPFGCFQRLCGVMRDLTYCPESELYSKKYRAVWKELSKYNPKNKRYKE